MLCECCWNAAGMSFECCLTAVRVLCECCANAVRLLFECWLMLFGGARVAVGWLFGGCSVPRNACLEVV
eukprot:8210961-Lingulodinium_polyedra.AAC.1